MRRASLPLVQTLIGGIVIQTRLDEVEMAVAALMVGDGSGSLGTTIGHTHLSTYQGGTPATFATMTLKGYLMWLATFYPGKCTTIIGNAGDVLDAYLLASPSTVPIWLNSLIDKGGLGGAPVIVNNPLGQNIRYVTHNGTIVATTLIGIDKRYAMIGYREVGTDLTETDKIINGQYTDIVISNTIGFQTIFDNARTKLNATDADA